jgi:hypothetical protein
MEFQSRRDSRNVPLKIISLLLGFTFWYIFGNSHITTAWITIPLCFYNIPKQSKIKAPESVSVKITGKRSHLRTLDTHELAIHVNSEKLHNGKNVLQITPETIFLPESIKLVDYCPSNPTVELIKKS